MRARSKPDLAPALADRCLNRTPSYHTLASLRRPARCGVVVDVVAATPDEPDPASAHYNAEVAPGWHYRGVRATQYWHARARPDLVVRVNGRQTYWGSRAAIPGGVAYENFELEAPFEPGQEFNFGITPEAPESLGFRAPR